MNLDESRPHNVTGSDPWWDRHVVWILAGFLISGIGLGHWMNQGASEECPSEETSESRWIGEPYSAPDSFEERWMASGDRDDAVEVKQPNILEAELKDLKRAHIQLEQLLERQRVSAEILTIFEKTKEESANILDWQWQLKDWHGDLQEDPERVQTFSYSSPSAAGMVVYTQEIPCTQPACKLVKPELERVQAILESIPPEGIPCDVCGEVKGHQQVNPNSDLKLSPTSWKDLLNNIPFSTEI